MKIKKFTTIFVGVFVFLFGIVLSVYAAWGYGGNEAPYTGDYTNWSVYGPGITSYAHSMQWSQSAINDMKWDSTSEWLDQTADCVGQGGDRLHATASSTNIPNYGFSIYNDCGNSSWKEETELKINPYSLSTATTYYQYVWWDCVYGNASGELNVSFEPALWAHEWLDKTNYQCPNHSAANNDDLPALGTVATSNGNKPAVDGDNKPELIREVDNGIYSYQVVRTPNGHIRVYSDIDFLDKAVLEAYQAENKSYLNALLSKQTQDESLFVVVTFTTPLSVKDVQDLIQQTQMDVGSYGIFGHIGNEVVSTYKFPLSGLIEDFSQDSQQLENEGEIIYDGIMTLAGYINSEKAQILDEHHSVYLLDLTANKIQSEISDLKEVGGSEQFAIPNPAWLVYIGDVSATK